MEELIRQLGKLVAEKMRTFPNAQLDLLLDELNETIAHSSQLQQRFQEVEGVYLQINQDNARGYQTIVNDGVAYVGDQYHVDADTLKVVLDKLLEERLPVGNPSNLPRSGVARFVGRDEELKNLNAQLQQGDVVAISAIAGMGGVGKTELAIQYAKAFKEVYPAGICWLLAREQNIGTQLVSYALVELGLRVPDGIELPDQVRFCWRNWPAGDALIVLDDVIKYSEVKPYLPPENPRFKVLMTTRRKIGPPVQSLPLGVLTSKQSLELLESLIGKERVKAELEVTKTLCEWLGHLPLGLELVGRYLLLEEDLSIAQMLFRLEQKAETQEAIDDESLEVDPDTEPSTAERGVKAAFELSWAALDEESKHLGKLLSLFALAPIPWELAERVKQKYCEMFPENGDFVAEDLRTAKRNLQKLHLIQVAGEGAYQLHSLIREFFRNKLEHGEVALGTDT